MGLSESLHKAQQRKSMATDAEVQVEILAQLRLLNEQIAWQNRTLAMIVADRQQHAER